MHETIIPAVIAVAGLAAGEALAAYARWIIRCRRPELTDRISASARVTASLVNSMGWMAAWYLGSSAMDGAFLCVIVSAAVVLTLIDLTIRVIPNELVAALLALTAAMALMEEGFHGLPGRLVGFLTALTLFLVAMLAAGPGKVGGGDVKLAAAVGFAAGFPNVLMAILIMAGMAGLTGAAGILLKKMGRQTPMPFAGFLMAGLAAAVLLDRAGALGFMAWQ